MHRLPIFCTLGCTGLNGELGLWPGVTGLETLLPRAMSASPPGDQYFCISEPCPCPIRVPPANGLESSALTTHFTGDLGPGFCCFIFFHRPLLRASTQALEHRESTENSLVCVEAGLSSVHISTWGQRILTLLEEAFLTLGRSVSPSPQIRLWTLGSWGMGYDVGLVQLPGHHQNHRVTTAAAGTLLRIDQFPQGKTAQHSHLLLSHPF